MLTLFSVALGGLFVLAIAAFMVWCILECMHDVPLPKNAQVRKDIAVVLRVLHQRASELRKGSRS